MTDELTRMRAHVLQLQEYHVALDRVKDENDRLRALNAEMVESLKVFIAVAERKMDELK